MAGFILRVLTLLLGIPLLLGWLWIAKTYDQFWLVLLLLALVTAAASWEYAKLVALSGIPLERLTFAVVSVLTVVAYGALSEAHTSLIFIAGALLFIVGYLPRSEGLQCAASALLGFFYLPYLLHFFFPLFQTEQGYYYTLLLLLLVWAYDTGAYIVGSLLGKHKLFPRLSPKKSWEGVFGGWFLAFVAGWLSFLWIPWAFSLPDAALHGFALSLLISVFAQLGDLFESKLKRTASVKDSGAFFPGHGGMLDRIDSLLFALPAFYFYVHYVLKWV
ncbi:MAG: hypothetical protein A2Z21_00015 [Candidatus Fraserbacteria bacterium RBG_16_55_9]|uniref:Phosphatidate cytidylyltransferase n=1 Tax=Fraserbacteria sp. (strain RBG_16_55_9) TaxID=1817864 RepID=A0A1F5UQH5_FRAXR|nr:MAG: hypothetical protein A2Z21_00015 [Candidatus Fraserbacteria bacterium RBG_16_55_9]